LQTKSLNLAEIYNNP